MITIELTGDDASFLLEQLADQRRRVQNELLHTDRRALKAAIAGELERLDGICDRIAKAASSRAA